jgi:hypothetical protein
MIHDNVFEVIRVFLARKLYLNEYKIVENNLTNYERSRRKLLQLFSFFVCFFLKLRVSHMNEFHAICKQIFVKHSCAHDIISSIKTSWKSVTLITSHHETHI